MLLIRSLVIAFLFTHVTTLYTAMQASIKLRTKYMSLVNMGRIKYGLAKQSTLKEDACANYANQIALTIHSNKNINPQLYMIFADTSLYLKDIINIIQEYAVIGYPSQQQLNNALGSALYILNIQQTELFLRCGADSNARNEDNELICIPKAEPGYASDYDDKYEVKQKIKSLLLAYGTDIDDEQ